ncbi:PepSY domain-containing protein [Hyphomonas pacifica]|uniref:PepSY domain-containing protein n=1 Tax=Hyphomonas pacifica TaxID=1280941 RepID=A0A062TT71_9PROT|nr:PepSY domain-containing protein [Hyphomonas pacifica]KCZ51176.1 hypothetical protein HY2_12085 [Hyphomonas pacifica]MBR9806542.1 PepSY domain-containing protein [Alphaproteobacteria bacterium]RAN33655.1 hypothetical protein HY3_12185 [Hyphomonas pacifica]RAN35574.1 hypothetical protein HY11_13785 [Hyphomonas pacifica]
MKRLFALCLTIGLALTPPAMAQDWKNSWSPGQARDSVREGKTVPLSQIFQSLKRQYGGYQLGADLFDRGGNPQYRIDWMTGDGRKMRFIVDARTGRILDRQGA